MISVFMEVLKGGLILLGELALIITAIMIVVEVLQEYKILNKLTAITSPLTKITGIPRDGNLPLLAGLVLGIGYGGAIIIDCAREGKLSGEDIFLINLFLVICHSLVEDTLIWMAIGAKAIPVQIARLLIAIIFCYLFSLYINRRKKRFDAAIIPGKISSRL